MGTIIRVACALSVLSSPVAAAECMGDWIQFWTVRPFKQSEPPISVIVQVKDIRRIVWPDVNGTAEIVIRFPNPDPGPHRKHHYANTAELKDILGCLRSGKSSS